MGYPERRAVNQPGRVAPAKLGNTGRRPVTTAGLSSPSRVGEEVQVNTRTIAIAALVIAVILLLFFIL
jgi:hypothetical protein